ncbi:hypothetical protein BDK63_000305 [Halomonas campaniensis]|uniref:Uncharacterized protein n=1 Tax=Halomonas campaniensis TaxID=213554 RepID=A0A7W5P9C1_9GAMM|nr:hypothetical protein [Halomonas campaniensis]
MCSMILGGNNERFLTGTIKKTLDLNYTMTLNIQKKIHVRNPTICPTKGLTDWIARTTFTTRPAHDSQIMPTRHHFTPRPREAMGEGDNQ